MKRLCDLTEHVVDRINQATGGAEVAVQGVQGVWVAFDRAVTRTDVGAEVSATEAVNSLLGVADHDQGVVLVHRIRVINAVQAVVLPRIGVLEFVHHGHGVLGADGRRHLPIIRVQGGVQALQQVLEIKTGLLLLGLFVTLAHLLCGMVEQGCFARRFQPLLLIDGLDVRKHGMVRRLRPTPVLQQAGAEPPQGVGLDVFAALGPGLQCGHPFEEIVIGDA